MSNGRATTERVYTLLKAALPGAAISPAGRLDLPLLAARFEASLTPCREAAFRLVGERLLSLHPRGGFSVPQRTDTELRNLYSAHEALVLLMIDRSRINRASREHGDWDGTRNIADRTRQLFAYITEDCPNVELRRMLDALADRLASPRLVEQDVAPVAATEIATLVELYHAGVARKLVRAIRTYHRRRVTHARLIESELAVRRVRGTRTIDPT